MREHVLKCWISSYDAIERGEKRCEFRLNDRDFEVGDVLILRRWDPHVDYATAPNYPKIRRLVTHVVHGGRFGVPVGYCMMSLGDDR